GNLAVVGIAADVGAEGIDGDRQVAVVALNENVLVRILGDRVADIDGVVVDGQGQAGNETGRVDSPQGQGVCGLFLQVQIAAVRAVDRRARLAIAHRIALVLRLGEGGLNADFLAAALGDPAGRGGRDIAADVADSVEVPARRREEFGDVGRALRAGGLGAEAQFGVGRPLQAGPITEHRADI